MNLATPLQESEKTQEALSRSRETYRPIAARGSTLYFAVSSLSSLDPMYSHSLPYFKRLFGQGLREAPASDDLGTRIRSLLDTQVCRACRCV